jgi:transcriptional regulator with XRE-family HTH domain
MRPKEQGAALRRRRLREGYTQRELGLLVGCSHAMIGLLERDETTVGDALAARIAKRLRTDLEDIFEQRTSSTSTRTPTAASSVRRRKAA